MKTHLDTHVVTWLYEALVDRLSHPARDAIVNADAIGVSPMVSLELTYLHQTSRLAVDGPTIVASLHHDLGLDVDDTSLERVVSIAHGQDWTRDPFDRLIAAQALAAGAQLVTADRRIRDHLPAAVW